MQQVSAGQKQSTSIERSRAIKNLESKHHETVCVDLCGVL